MRSKMTMRTTIERDIAAEDPWGGDAEPNWQPHLPDVPCYGYIASTGGSAGRVAIDENRTVTIEDRRVGMPLDTDVTSAHRLTDIVDRQGQVLFDGPMEIGGILRRTTHLELIVKREGSP